MRAIKSQSGALMIEVLVTITIVIIGLWGLMDVQSRLQKSEMESYQRTQALLLLNDMVSRISTNRSESGDLASANYETTAIPASSTCPVTGTAIYLQDLNEWCLALQGAAETSSTNTNIGALIDGRGCVDALANSYRVTVVWQGLSSGPPPPLDITCGATLYNKPAGSGCATAPESCRRYVSTVVRIADLNLL